MVLSFPERISLALVSLRLCSDKNVSVYLSLEPFYQHHFVVASFYLVAEVSSRHSSPLFRCGPGPEETEESFQREPHNPVQTYSDFPSKQINLSASVFFLLAAVGVDQPREKSTSPEPGRVEIWQATPSTRRESLLVRLCVHHISLFHFCYTTHSSQRRPREGLTRNSR